MGQAKNRGSFEERRTQAIEKKRTVSRVKAMLKLPTEKLGELFVRDRVMSAFKAKPETAGRRAAEDA